MTAAILAASPSCIMCRRRHTTAMAKVISLSTIPIRAIIYLAQLRRRTPPILTVELNSDAPNFIRRRTLPHFGRVFGEQAIVVRLYVS